MSKTPFPTGSTKGTTRPLELVHSNIMDLVDAHPSLRYVLTLKDDYTKYLWVAPLACRSDMAAVFPAWHREMKTKLPKKPLAALRTDNRGDYTANAFTDYLSSHGIIHQTSLPHTPQQNGVYERVNRTLMDRVRAMTTGASLSSKFWPYALECLDGKNLWLPLLLSPSPRQLWEVRTKRTGQDVRWTLQCSEGMDRSGLGKQRRHGHTLSSHL
ncbi:unnamed protein product [Closterium sp. NIES-53]